ncbi:hypothetical protein D3C75_1054230 [compost metagenome]
MLIMSPADVGGEAKILQIQGDGSVDHVKVAFDQCAQGCCRLRRQRQNMPVLLLFLRIGEGRRLLQQDMAIRTAESK